MAAGHEGSGLALGPATAAAMAAYVLEEPQPTGLTADMLGELLPATRLLLADV